MLCADSIWRSPLVPDIDVCKIRARISPRTTAGSAQGIPQGPTQDHARIVDMGIDRDYEFDKIFSQGPQQGPDRILLILRASEAAP